MPREYKCVRQEKNLATAAIEKTGIPRAPLAPSKPRSRVSGIWPAAIIIYATMLPPEFSLYIDTFRIGAYQLAIFLMLPWLLGQILKGRIKLGLIDIGMVITALWLPVSFTQNYDLSTGIEAGGSQTVDILLSYLIGRCAIKNFASLRRLLIVISPGLLIAGLLLFFESVGGSLFVRQTAQAIFGVSGELNSALAFEKRLGLVRAYGPFQHPIHAGLFMSAFLPLYFMSFKRKALKFRGLLFGVLGFFTLSSAALLALVLSAAMLTYDWIQKYLKNIGWKIALMALAALIFFIQIFSQNGVLSVIYRYLTLNPATGYYRTQIWAYASDDVFAHPWFGIGYEAYTRPYWFWGSDSIDAHYLSMAVKYGLVPALLYFSITIGIIVLLSQRASISASLQNRDKLVGMVICLSTIVIMLFTVTFWGGILAWLNLMLGMSLSIVKNPQNFASRL